MKTILHMAAVIALAISTISAQLEGPPDLPLIRQSFSSQPNVMTLRLKFHVVQTDRITALVPDDRDAAIDLLVGELNSIYQYAAISFVKAETEFILPGSEDLLAIDSSDEKRRLMDELINRDEATKFLNIVVVPIQNLGFDGHATFPWSRRALREGSGILLSDEFVFPFDNGDLDPLVAAHEIGHALGLWHVERGVNDHETDGLVEVVALRQIPALVSDIGADARGDFCQDTPPIPYADELGLRYTIDLDQELNDGETFKETYISTPAHIWPARDIANLMRSSGDRRFISLQQKGRMRGWINHRLGSWLERPGTSAVEAVLGDPTFSGNDFKPGIRLEWQAPVGSTFQIHRSENPDFSISPVQVSSTQAAIDGTVFSQYGVNWQRFTTTDDGVENGKSYWYRVRIGSNAATASFSPRMDVRGAGARTNNARPGLIPVASSLRSVPGGVLVEWQDSADEEISGFELERSPAFPAGVEVQVKPGTSRFASFFDKSPSLANSNYTYQIYSYYDSGTRRIHSGNIGDGPEQGKPVIYTPTPPPDRPVLSYTKANTPQGWRGTISASFRGKVPAPTTTGGEIRAVLQSQTDTAPTWVAAGTSGILTTGASSPSLFSIGNRPTGANYHFRLDLVETLKDEGGTVIGTESHGFSQPITIRIPGGIYTAPVPGQPATGETGTFPYPTFTWNAVQDAEFYDIIIRGPNYDNTTIRIPAGSGNQLSYALNAAFYPELDALATYTWRVRAGNVETPNGGPLSLAQSFTTQLHPPNLVSPADGFQIDAPNQELTVEPTFTWGGIPGNVRYRLSVRTGTGGTNEIFSALTNTASVTVSAAEAIDSGSYVWDVTAFPRDQSYASASPKVVSATRSFTVRTVPRIAPAQYLPEDGSVECLPYPTFEWQARSQANDYVIEIIRGNEPDLRWRFGGETADNLLGEGVPVVGEPTAGDPSRLRFKIPDTLTGLPGARKYYWRIRARNELGGGDWSAPNSPDQDPDNWKDGWWNFTTRLLEPTLLSPANGATTGDSSPTLSWTSAAGTSSNEVEVYSGTVIAGSPVATQTVSGNSWNMPLETNELSDGNYIWRVRSLGPASGNPQVVSGWSEASFSVLTPPRNAPNPRNPITYDLNRQITPNFQWDPLSKATSYRIEIRLGTGTTIFNQGGITGSGDPLTYTLPAQNALAYGTDYTWRIRGASSSGEGPVSAWNTFRTELPATVPLSPASGGYVSDRTPILRATPVTGATRYEFKIVKGDPANAIYGTGFSNTGSNSWTVDPFLSNGTYYWSVRAIGPPSDGSNGPWSGDFTLVVRGEPTIAPTQTNPANNATDTNLRPTFRWSTVNIATAYDLQINDASGGALVVNLSNIAATEFQITTNLTNNHSYYWRVRARNEFGTGPWSASNQVWSEYFKFRTKP
jgi:hypothetical protein